ncbi:MAG: SMP-30/gluconolactonase/LRE family protein [Actinomycetota bacterium]|nr:SMP-30/gluconolactonase/LRE family protein [Actinomycetota bacterium]
MRNRGIVAVLAAALVLAAAPAQASVRVERVVSFDPAAGELPEGLTVDARDNAYVSLVNPVAQIRRIGPDGTGSVVAHFDVGGFGPLGLAVDHHGHLFVAMATFDPATRGVYEVWPNGTSTRLPGTDSIQFPNGLALDHHGDMYVTDSIGGAVWRIPRGGSAHLWVQDPLLTGDGSVGLGFPLGANGISVAHDHAVVVSNTEGGRIVRVPVTHDGGAGAPTVLAEAPELYGADGIALDVFGRTYVAVNPQSTLVRVDADGSITTLATAGDGLDNPASPAFGTSEGDRENLFLTNFAAFSSSPDPALLKALVGAPGLRVP